VAQLKIPNARKIAGMTILVVGLAVGAPRTAQAYQIDCAILICLAGGWPATAECVDARETFIERITPSPIEPPLQIWNCPLSASYDRGRDPSPLPRPVQIAARDEPVAFEASTTGAPWAKSQSFAVEAPMIALKSATQNTIKSHVADVDISGPEYEFVRSIRVYHVAYAQQRQIGGDDIYCRRTQDVRVGTYGKQGEFGWSESSVANLPMAFEGLEGWGESCPSVGARAVFVDWQDFGGTYGFEQVTY